MVTADLVPIAVVIAASPFPVIPAILLVLTPRATANAGAFLGGWATGILAGTAAFIALAAVVEGFDEPPTWASWARVALGAALVVLGVRQWLSRGDTGEAPAWMRSLDESTPGSAARLGVLLSAANPKILLLTAAAGLTIADAGLSPSAVALTVLLFALAGSVTVALPLLLYVVLGERATVPLRRVEEWLEAHNATVMAVVIVAIGAVLLAKGIGGL